MSKVHIICFASCYLIAAVTELLRRVRLRSSGCDTTFLFVISVVVTLAGLAAQSMYLFYQFDIEAGLAQTGITPLSSLKGCVVSASWFLAIVFLASLRRKKVNVYPFFLLGMVELLIVLGSFLPETRFARPPVLQAWGIIHGLSQLIFFTSLTTGLIVGILYFIQTSRLKQKRTGWCRLPALEWLTRINRLSLIWAAVALAPGIVSGFVLLKTRNSGSDLLGDPAIIGSIVIFIWIIWLLVRSIHRPALSEGRAAAGRTIFLFFLLIVCLLAACLSPNGHWSLGQSETSQLESQTPQSLETGQAVQNGETGQTTHDNDPGQATRSLETGQTDQTIQDRKTDQTTHDNEPGQMIQTVEKVEIVETADTVEKVEEVRQ